MLRIHFTDDDLARIRIRSDPHPLWEVLLSLHLLQTRHAVLMFGAWRRDVRTALRPTDDILTTLAPPKGYSPDFLTPLVDSPDLEAGLEVVLRTGSDTLSTDMSRLASQTTLPSWANRLAAGDADMMRRLADCIRQYHAKALQPYAQVLQAYVRADWARRAELAMTYGLGHVLSTLHPTIRWRSPVLEVGYPVDQDLYLAGRGLVLVPSFFCWRMSMTVADPALQPVLVYPVDPVPGWTAKRHDVSRTDRDSLVALIGRTRALVLLTIADRPYLNTTELARAAGTSPAGASQHATVLREAGLVITQRRNGSAVHTLSQRGAVLLGRSGGPAELARDVRWSSGASDAAGGPDRQAE
ncbi:ArsR/SmtB family transcription factor [Actinocrispum wychmicini]|uniref:DNA-binding transcriptional ArsR family regulator n=1 Tax=Actinocrispum wychmicini TaxID=1213861 RepID=A0A4R2JIQ1_9PSEU|nr:winged helix-turn-helix domain-containing protein [Actinocrispum wychmicini]TCO59771.1 DNA-binding transcriptional ArsR family regulator [Actinocrispum wychmicini]